MTVFRPAHARVLIRSPGMAAVEILVADRVFLEGPRWRPEGLYVSDIHGDEVLLVQPDGTYEVLAELERPSGIGFLPDRRMLVTTMGERKVYRLEPDRALAVHADCSAHVSWPINDMVTDRHGNAIMGQVGFDYFGGEPPKAVPMVLARPDGSVTDAGGAFLVANGPVILADERTLVVAESQADRLSACDLADDGTLSNQRVWAEVPAHSHPDGICLDAEGAVWVALLDAEKFIRVRQGGEVVGVVETPGRRAVACALGGDDGRTLFLLTTTARGNRAAMQEARGARIEITQVDVPGCQRP